MTVAVEPSMPRPMAGCVAATIPSYYAGFCRRMVAAAIDGVIMLVLVVVISIAAGASVGVVNGETIVRKDGRSIPLSEIAKPSIVVSRDGAQTTTVETTTTTVGFQTIHSVVTRTSSEQQGNAKPRTSSSVNLSLSPSPLAFALFFTVWLLVSSVLESSRLRGSLGKLVMFIRVADMQGHRVTLPRAIARNLLKVVSTLPLCLGYLMAAWTIRKQALHDQLAECTVVVAVG